jgi:hypothetical protein
MKAFPFIILLLAVFACEAADPVRDGSSPDRAIIMRGSTSTFRMPHFASSYSVIPTRSGLPSVARLASMAARTLLPSPFRQHIMDGTPCTSTSHMLIDAMGLTNRCSQPLTGE